MSIRYQQEDRRKAERRTYQRHPELYAKYADLDTRDGVDRRWEPKTREYLSAGSAFLDRPGLER